MPNSPQSINVSFTTTSSYAFTQPVQQTTFLDATNRNYLRSLFVSQDGVKMVSNGQVVQIPMSQLFLAAVTYNPTLTWPPIILTQPSSSNFSGVTPATASLKISASAELPITYQWYSGSSASGSWFALTDQSFSNNSIVGSLTATLTLNCFDTFSLCSKYYECIATDASGNTTSSVANLTLF